MQLAADPLIRPKPLLCFIILNLGIIWLGVATRQVLLTTLDMQNLVCSRYTYLYQLQDKSIALTLISLSGSPSV